MSIYPAYPVFNPIFNYVTLSNLVPGDFVSLIRTGGDTYVVDKVIVDPYKVIFGFVTTTVLAGDVAGIYNLGLVNDKLSGLTPGATYYASPTIVGGITTVSPTGTALIFKLGIAINTTNLDTQYYQEIEGTGTGGGGGGTTTNVLVDGGTFMVPFDNTLIDAGAF